MTEANTSRASAELIGFAKGIIADGVLSDEEILALQRYLAASAAGLGDPVVGILVNRLRVALSDGRIDEEERRDLFEGLSALVGGPTEEGETQKSTSLPLTIPPPDIHFHGNRFCLTGNFALGTRAECEARVTQRGGTVGGLAKSTRYLVVGEYVTPAWKHLSYGLKIARAQEMVADGVPVAIVPESHWITFL